jgi:hypothetical protein
LQHDFLPQLFLLCDESGEFRGRAGTAAKDVHHVMNKPGTLTSSGTGGA